MRRARRAAGGGERMTARLPDPESPSPHESLCSHHHDLPAGVPAGRWKSLRELDR